jgi:hypothetical protein
MFQNSMQGTEGDIHVHYIQKPLHVRMQLCVVEKFTNRLICRGIAVCSESQTCSGALLDRNDTCLY